MEAGTAALPDVVDVGVRSFLPIRGRHARVLILGSMPGIASLTAAQYYAHPRNAFWSIAQALFGIARAQPYAARVRDLEAAHIAVWDVLATCRRRSSLDSDIEPASIVANDLRDFLRRNAGIRSIYFNGNTASRLYAQHVLATLTPRQQLIVRRTLPSTSPAHAGLTLEQKITAWAVIGRDLADHS
jgi:double-stranded uracil-DNA glycosylase